MSNDLEKQFEQQMLARYEAWKAFGYVANRFLMSVRNRGGVGAAKHLLAKNGISPGLARLAKEKRADLSMEALVLIPPWDSLFTETELAKARSALGAVR
ncbi:MAG: hypothetical protein OEW39_00055 [Deltaproteobacteria bacterium]|nr:hypothetical protein [Deltaproteobacteria bacterium]